MRMPGRWRCPHETAGSCRLPPAQATAWTAGLPSVHDGFFFAIFEKT